MNLNDAPTEVDKLNDLPIKSADGTVVYIRDVAFVHLGSPPQLNIVRVDGKNAVLMTILKAGSASTLDVINGVKKLLPTIKAGLPKSLELEAVGDQSKFVNDAVDGVIREGAIAATLTGLLILIFLGSWRSTIIIMVSIPLAILFSVTVLSLLGETINVMTLGGLALAVGIPRRRRHGHHREHQLPPGTGQADRGRDHGRLAPDRRAGDGVAALHLHRLRADVHAGRRCSGFLFKPLAEAVIFALIGSYILSRTLVPTIANYLLANQCASRARRAAGERPATRWSSSSAASSIISRSCAAATARCS